MANAVSVRGLTALGYALKSFRWAVTAAVYSICALFAGGFILDAVVSPAAKLRNPAVRWVLDLVNPVVADATALLNVSTKVQGYELMPIFIAMLVYVVFMMLAPRLSFAEEWVEEQKQRILLEEKRLQRKAVQDLAFSSEKTDPKGLLSKLVGKKEGERDRLLRDLDTARKRLDQAKENLAFLSIDVVGSTKMKIGQDPYLSEQLFRNYRALVESVLKKHRHRASSWTPDGIMACFNQPELACSAAQTLLRALPQFNKNDNPLGVQLRVRCGLHMGKVFFDGSTPLELIVDRTLDITGHLQKFAEPDTLAVSAEVFQSLRDKGGFVEAPEPVDGLNVYEWSLEPRPKREPKSVQDTAGAGHQTTGTAMIPMGKTQMVKTLGRYEILEEIGRGAMGVVYKAKDPQIGRTVAIKMILSDLCGPDSAEFRERFIREAQSAGRMSHPGIVTIYDILQLDNGQLGLVLEFVEGTTLDKVIGSKRTGDVKRLPFPEALDIAIQVADALDEAHQFGIIHRDIKPENILYTSNKRAKIADFGIAKTADSHVTHTGQILGTPAYMSPEQFKGGPIDNRTDIFSLGAMLYRMLTGELPFPGDTVTSIMYKVLHEPAVPARTVLPDLPADLEEVLSRCLAKDPAQRYGRAREMMLDLTAVRHGHAISARQDEAAAGQGSEAATGRGV